MIKKSGSGYVVTSESGKKLSRVLPSKDAAASRLKQVEYFKNREKTATTRSR